MKHKSFSWSSISRYWLAIVTVLLFAAIFCCALYYLLHQSRTFTHQLIAHDITRLSQVFTKINQECGITGFEHQRNYIDFLTVEKFSGSEVGGMQLRHPEKWKGSYMHENPTVQNAVYEIVRTKKGYFIVPGQGVRLNSHAVVGKDILFNEDADVEQMIADGVLQYQDQPLAAKINMNHSIDAGKILDVAAQDAEEY